MTTPATVNVPVATAEGSSRMMSSFVEVTVVTVTASELGAMVAFVESVVVPEFTTRTRTAFSLALARLPPTSFFVRRIWICEGVAVVPETTVSVFASGSFEAIDKYAKHKHSNIDSYSF
jgi:hypothetical protein